MDGDFRVVLDTNVILASFFSSNIKSPNKEILARWKTGDLTLLYSDDIHFLLCAVNGDADYLISGDRHLLDLSPFYRPTMTICKPRVFVDLKI